MISEELQSRIIAETLEEYFSVKNYAESINSDELNSMFLKHMANNRVLEIAMPADVEDKINEFAKLSDEIDRVTAELKKLNKRYKSIEDDLRPLLDNMKELKDKTIITKKYILTVKVSGYDKSSPKYKEAFYLALSKVNKATKNILTECLEANTTVARVTTTLSVQKVDEGIIDNVIKLFQSAINKFKTIFNKNIKDVDLGNKILQRL